MRTVARVPPFDRPATYEDLAGLADNLVGEIVEGELHATPRPALRHAHAGSRLGQVLLPAFNHPGPGGWCLLYEPELHLGADILVPDWAGWRRERMPRVPDAAFSLLAPDWVCEILSPSTVAFDRSRKLAVYAREEVAHLWLVDPAALTLEVLQLDAHRWSILETRLGNEVVRVPPFQEVEMRLSLLWGEDEGR